MLILIPIVISLALAGVVFILARQIIPAVIKKISQLIFNKEKIKKIPIVAWVFWEINRERSARRGRQAAKNFTVIIDLLRLYVSAGQNLDQAIRSVSRAVSGVWKVALATLVRELDLGVDLEAALGRSSARLNLPEFSRVLLALRQARQLGVPLGNALSVQATLVRNRHKQAAEAAARSASVKIALPLVLCIFPALLIIYLAPAVLRLLQGV